MPKKGESNLMVQTPPFVRSMLDDLTSGGRITKKQVVEDAINLLWEVTQGGDDLAQTLTATRMIQRKYNQETAHATDHATPNEPTARK